MVDILTPRLINSEGLLDKQLGLAISYFTPDYIVEVGTFDGEGVKKFGKYSPRSGLVGFEANPYNYFTYCIGKPVHNIAISDKVGTIKINEPIVRSEVKNNYKHTNLRVSSVYEVVDTTEFRTYDVLSTTLDHFFAVPIQQGATFVLIVDAEGATWNVLNGATQFLKNTIMIKAEVERIECYNNQKLIRDIEQLLVNDFAAVASTELKSTQLQHNRYYCKHKEHNSYFLTIGEEAKA